MGNTCGRLGAFAGQAADEGGVSIGPVDLQELAPVRVAYTDRKSPL